MPKPNLKRLLRNLWSIYLATWTCQGFKFKTLNDREGSVSVDLLNFAERHEASNSLLSLDAPIHNKSELKMSYSDALKHLQQLIRSSEQLAALGVLAKVRSGRASVDKSVESALIEVMDSVNPSFLDEISTEELAFLGETAYGNLFRLTQLVAAPNKAGSWAYSDPTVLEAQGKSSRAITRFLSAHAQKDKYFYKLLDHGEPFLDVGSGVGWLSITMAQEWPNLSIDGLEIFKPALQIAEKNLKASGLEHRISFSNQNVTEIDVIDKYASAFVPLMFIPEEAVLLALPKLRKAIRTGGILFVATYSTPEDPTLRALNHLQTVISGGRVWLEDEIRTLLSSEGFTLDCNITPNAPISIYKAK